MEKHIPVLAQKVIEHLAITKGNTVFDGTVGLGGHATHLIRAMQGGTFIGVDVDAEALKQAEQNIRQVPSNTTLHFVEENFRNIVAVTEKIGVQKYDRMLLDLGWGSHQLKSGRGFSFMHNEPLNMCYGTACTINAFDVVNTFEESNLSDIIYGYGGERWAVRIAKHIVEERKKTPIETTLQLSRIISGAVPRRFHPKKIHIATRTFQAIRIAVNDEIGALKQFLAEVQAVVQPQARIAILSFHSLEDRVVKKEFRAWEREGSGKRYTKKAQRPEPEECKKNPRARSARLRTFIFT